MVLALFLCCLISHLRKPEFPTDSAGSPDDVLADIAIDPDDQLGLDHVNKNRNFWNRSESFFIR